MSEIRETITSIEVNESKVIFVEKIIETISNGNVIGSVRHRSSFEPHENINSLPADAQDVARSVWTSEVVNAAISRKAAGPSNRIGG